MKKTLTYFIILTGCIGILFLATSGNTTHKPSSPCKMEKQSDPVSIDQSFNNFFSDNI
jgi:hypothetical protein